MQVSKHYIFLIQWTLYRRPPAKGDHLPSRPLFFAAPTSFLLYILTAKGDHLSTATTFSWNDRVVAQTGSTVLCCRDACVCTCAKRLKRHLKFSTPLYGQIIPKKKTQKVSVTWCSQAVTHPSTNHALLCLTSVIGRELVLSQWYER